MRFKFSELREFISEAIRTGLPMGTAGKHRFIYVSDTSEKFWEVERKGNTVTVNFGLVGAYGQTKIRKFSNEYEAIKFTRIKIREKLDKGYHEQ